MRNVCSGLRRPVWIIAIAALFPAGRNAWQRLTVPSIIAAPDADYVHNLARARPHLIDVPLITYVTDLAELASPDVITAGQFALRAAFELFLAQRALAPTFVRPDLASPWLLANYSVRRRLPEDWAQRGLIMVEDLGNGIALFRTKR